MNFKKCAQKAKKASPLAVSVTKYRRRHGDHRRADLSDAPTGNDYIDTA